MHVTIIGGGASGLMAAFAAARQGARVTLLEKEARVGKKLLTCGNGRCNVLNLRPSPSHYHGGGAQLANALIARVPPKMLLGLFGEIGLFCREEAEGRVYPVSGQASSVLDALRFACDRLDVDTQCGQELVRIQRVPDGYALYFASGEKRTATRVVLATGGAAAVRQANGYALLQSLGLPVTPLLPALVQLRLDPSAIRGLKGVRADVCMTLFAEDIALRTESGEALFTDYGLSGVAAMQCARAAGMACAQKKRVTLVLSLLPDWHAADVRRMMESRAVYWANAPMDRFFTGLLHKRIGLCLMQPLGISPTQTAASLTREQLLALSERLQAWHLPVLGTQDLTQAQVTAGGADVSAFDPQTLEATACPGLYATGELLDIDGDCGGYNLLWAWVSGWIAGQNAASNPLEGNIT